MRTFHMLQQIKAAAGSGKTYTLTRQFLELLASAAQDEAQEKNTACAIANPDGSFNWYEILAVTFTNKAATEMRERVIHSLKECALQTDPTNPAQGWNPKDAHRWVNRLLQRYSSLNIRTIDSLLNMLVRLGALDLSLPPDFEPIFDDAVLFDPLYDQMLTRASQGGNERALVKEACKSLLFHTDMNGFVPGDRLREKVHTLMQYRLEHGALPDVDGDALRGWLGMLHEELNHCATSIQKFIAEEGIKPAANFTKFLDKCLALSIFSSKLPSATYAKKPSIDDCVLKASKGKASSELHKAYADMCNAFAMLEVQGAILRKALELVPFINIAEPLAAEVETLQREKGIIPASQWPIYAQKVLSGEHAASEAFCRMGTRLTHLLIDEFQDTSKTQWKAIEPLAVECLAKDGSVVYVGDVKQAIYGWRGGDSDLFDGILNEDAIQAVAHDPERTTLDNNWRSSENVVLFNNEIFSRLEDEDTAKRIANDLVGKASPEVVDELAAEIVAGFSGAAQKVPPHKEGSGGLVKLYDIEAENTEALFESVHGELKKLFVDDLQHRRKLRDIAVLVRTNGEANMLANWLVEWGFPIITENSLCIADHPVIQQIVNLLTFLDYPLNDVAFWSVISGTELVGDIAGLDRTALDDWLATPRTGTLFNAFKADYPQVWEQWIAPFYSQAGLMSAYDTVREAFEHFDVFRRFPQDEIFLRRFLEIVHSAETNGLRSLSAFLTFWQEGGVEEKVPMPENLDAIRIITMHKSKGLEFPVVIIPFHHQMQQRPSGQEAFTFNGQDILVPQCKELGDDYYRAVGKDAREQLHLLYVAWTRPVEELHAVISATPTHERTSPLLKSLRVLLADLQDKMDEKGCITLGEVPENTRAEEQTEDDQTEKLLPEHEEVLAWKPMHWLPRLKIFRNPLEEIIYDERRRGILVHTCLEHLRVLDNPREDVHRAIQHGMREYPLPMENRVEVEEELADMLLWLTSLPQFTTWQHYGRPEQGIMDEHGNQHRADLLVREPDAITIVEYKTGGHDPAHKQQVRRYLNLLNAMPAYDNCALTGTIIYLDSRETVDVTLSTGA
nr:UvrD-helicase domain-containing protein [Halodesulfovibrio spirochaetisodalis]